MDAIIWGAAVLLVTVVAAAARVIAARRRKAARVEALRKLAPTHPVFSRR